MPHIPHLFAATFAPSPTPARGSARPAARQFPLPRVRRAANTLTILLASAALFLLAGCSAAHGALLPARDFLGNVWPQACRDQAALDAITISVIEVDKLPMRFGFDDGLYGLWIERPEGNAILIKRGMSPERRADVLRHEACHELQWRLTGDARWHEAR